MRRVTLGLLILLAVHKVLAQGPASTGPGPIRGRVVDAVSLVTLPVSGSDTDLRFALTKSAAYRVW